jgi:predicted nucleotidyltransferase
VVGFLDGVADRLAGLPGVSAVSLGGSRAQGTHRPDSDWDLAIYYRGTFDPQDLRDLQADAHWDGEVFELGDWGGGVFNSGAWLRIQGLRVDVHYRDLDVVEHELAQARAGLFRVEPLPFHLAGVPSYLVVGELALSQVLRGELPRPEYPEALRATAPRLWWRTAEMVFNYARTGHAEHGRRALSTGLLVQAATQAAHAVLAARGEWVTNEKTLLTRAGLGELDKIVTDPDPVTAVERAHALCADAVREAQR